MSYSHREKHEPVRRFGLRAHYEVEVAPSTMNSVTQDRMTSANQLQRSMLTSSSRPPRCAVRHVAPWLPAAACLITRLRDCRRSAPPHPHRRWPRHQASKDIWKMTQVTRVKHSGNGRLADEVKPISNADAELQPELRALDGRLPCAPRSHPVSADPRNQFEPRTIG